MDKIIIKGARQHNLKNIDVEIPKNKLVVFTGISGSGKSSLAFDTIYAEGQRRYVESLSSYARQFLGIANKPDVDTIDGLSPAISIEQKTTSHNPRSTVGTVTEIYDYLRLLYARVGHPHCPICGREISQQSAQQIAENALHTIKDSVAKNHVGRFLVMSPVVRDRKGEFSGLFENLRAKGYTRVRVDGRIYGLDEDLVLIKTNKHTIEVIVDRISIEKSQLKDKIAEENLRSRLGQSVEQALALSESLVIVSEILDAGFEMPDSPKKLEDYLFSEHFACPVDNISIPEIEPRMFSFNSPHGACTTCSGIGTLMKIDPDRIINLKLTLAEGAIFPMSNMFEQDTWYSRLVEQVAKENDFDIHTPLSELSKEQLDALLYGTGDEPYRVHGTNRFGRMTSIDEAFPGIIAELERRFSETESEFMRYEIKKYMVEKICPACNGARLKPEALSVTIAGSSIVDVTSLQISGALEFINELGSASTLLSPREQEIARLILKEVSNRLGFLVSVGLDYLTLDRPAQTLAGGEAQRIRLASQIGSGLTGVLYVLDEPTIGLHQRDNKRLIDTLKKLRDLGNTVIVVEHDREMMQNADWILDFGPGAGKHGGSIIFQGTLTDLLRDKNSLTGRYLTGKKDLFLAPGAPKVQTGQITLKGAAEHNLKDINVSFPLGKFICITGVSGSGKSTLLVDTLYPATRQALGAFNVGTAGKHKSIDGFENISRVSLIDQSPIGRTPRSNPATYTGIWSDIRFLFSQSAEARVRGYKQGRFSFNVKGGRCEACEGQGVNKIEMQFLSDVYVTCDVCGGRRFNRETLEVEWHGKNIADVLSLTVEEARNFFANIPQITNGIDTLISVGLDYIELGQAAPTLSGGEAQRVKLSAELGKRSGGSTFYILDEPTTGLHFADLEKLLHVFRQLVEMGNTVVVIEHNLDVIKNAEWVIDLGPEGGEKGGEVVAQGTPRDVARVKSSYTGQFLGQIIQ